MDMIQYFYIQSKSHDMSEFVHAHSDYPQFFKKVAEYVDEMDKYYYLYNMLKHK